MTFAIKTDLPQKTQDEITRIQAIASAQRTTTEAALLTSLAPYLTNEIIERDADDLITKAAGNTVPTGETGFKKGATFIKKDAVAGGLYQNTGDETSATWVLVADTDTDNNLLTDETPVNAVAASKVLTVGGTPSDLDTVTAGGKTYRFRSAIGAGVAAAGVLTAAANADNADTVQVEGKTYTFKTALTEVEAAGVLTATGNFVDAEDITIGAKTYKFTVNLSSPAVVNEVKIGATASDSLDNLIAAINGDAGEGTTYSTGTVASTEVTAAAGAGDTVDITAIEKGVAGNSIATTVDAASCSFGAVTLENGADAVANEILIAGSASASLDNLIAAMMGTAGEGTAYSTGTVPLASTSAAAGAGDTVDITALAVGTAGNAITSVGTGQMSFAAATLEGGVDAAVANDVLIGINAEAAIDNLVLAITAGAGAGTNYATGTTENANVTAVKASASTMTCTAKVKGTSGNSITIAKSGTNLTWASGATALSGGVDGTVASEGQMYKDSSYLYVAVSANTVADTNWRRVDLGSAY